MEPPTRPKAILLSLLVVIIWSSSWILIKFGSKDSLGLTFAGLRYLLTFLFLTPFLLKRKVRQQIQDFSKNDWKLIIMSILSWIFFDKTESAGDHRFDPGFHWRNHRKCQN